ncbi:hypothetical protein [Nocardioides convexus]|uniref:hypothetical protein n=1 Tax=Nocardioides convexus TaxID=2712224 RepID=UPI0024184AC7|nr:hypothetical protein [Nocardioides convexus]
MHQHFDAFLDIAWDSPEFAVDPNDPRWVLPKARPARRDRVVPVAPAGASGSRSAATATPTS